MSQSASQAQAFYREVATTKKVWTIKDKDGMPAPIGDGGKRAMPFWSSQKRAEKITQNIEAYKDFLTIELNWEDFRDKWLLGLENDGLNVGVNWSGALAKGYDVAPIDVKQNIEDYLF